VDSKNLREGLDKLRPSETITTERSDEKIDVEIREIIRVRPQDFSALKNSFEDWAKNWE
jgi:hypothetical protein